MNPLNHVAIIMDGNGRWGIKKKNSRNEGHRQGISVVENIIKETIIQNIKYLTLYTFSSDNWKRPKKETKFLFLLLENFINKNLSNIKKKKIRLVILGNKNKLSKNLTKLLDKSESETKNNSKLQINLALNYGSREEILDAVKKLVRNKIEINDKNLSNHLYTKDIPDPEVLIRTGNTNRLSNFLLWQLSYTEIFFEKKLWPDFTITDYKKILNQYKKIKRNFGSI